jgi:hypothetical protein
VRCCDTHPITNYCLCSVNVACNARPSRLWKPKIRIARAVSEAKNGKGYENEREMIDKPRPSPQSGVRRTSGHSPLAGANALAIRDRATLNSNWPRGSDRCPLFNRSKSIFWRIRLSCVQTLFFPFSFFQSFPSPPLHPLSTISTPLLDFF